MKGQQKMSTSNNNKPRRNDGSSTQYHESVAATSNSGVLHKVQYYINMKVDVLNLCHVKKFK